MHFVYICSLFAPEYESIQKAASQLQFNFFDEVVVNVKRVSRRIVFYILTAHSFMYVR